MKPAQVSVAVQAEETGEFHPVLFYALSISIAWIAWAPLLIHKFRGMALPVPYPLTLFVCQTIGAFAPLLSVLLIQKIKRAPRLVQNVFRNLRFRDVPVVWFLLPAAIPLSIAVATAVVHGTLSPEDGFTILRPGPVNDVGWALLFVIPFSFLMGLIGSPLGEEPGWRGYILDRMVDRGRSYLGSGIVATMWWIWHIPLFFVLDAPVNGYSFFEMAGHSLLIDSVFLLSGRNLLVAMIYHQGVSTSFMFFSGKTQTISGLVILLGVAIGVRVFAERHHKRTQVASEGISNGAA